MHDEEIELNGSETLVGCMFVYDFINQQTSFRRDQFLKSEKSRQNTNKYDVTTTALDAA